jgi:hypothetical protein
MNQIDRDELIDGIQSVVDELEGELRNELEEDLSRLRTSGSIEFEGLYEEIHLKIFNLLNIVL